MDSEDLKTVDFDLYCLLRRRACDQGLLEEYMETT